MDVQLDMPNIQQTTAMNVKILIGLVQILYADRVFHNHSANLSANIRYFVQKNNHSLRFVISLIASNKASTSSSVIPDGVDVVARHSGEGAGVMGL